MEILNFHVLHLFILLKRKYEIVVKNLQHEITQTSSDSAGKWVTQVKSVNLSELDLTQSY
jgi:hypothetical protein